MKIEGLIVMVWYFLVLRGTYLPDVEKIHTMHDCIKNNEREHDDDHELVVQGKVIISARILALPKHISYKITLLG